MKKCFLGARLILTDCAGTSARSQKQCHEDAKGGWLCVHCMLQTSDGQIPMPVVVPFSPQHFKEHCAALLSVCVCGGKVRHSMHNGWDGENGQILWTDTFVDRYGLQTDAVKPDDHWWCCRRWRNSFSETVHIFLRICP